MVKIDKLVAEHIMGGEIRPYSTVIQAAWAVVEKLAEEGIYLEVRRRKTGYTVVPFIKRENKRYGQSPYACVNSDNGWVRNNSVTKAICLAALRAKDIDTKAISHVGKELVEEAIDVCDLTKGGSCGD